MIDIQLLQSTSLQEQLHACSDKDALLKFFNTNPIFERLREFNPISAGTFPIDLQTPSSDLDILCEFDDETIYARTIKNSFSQEQNFSITTGTSRDQKYVLARFETTTYPVEIYGQNKSTRQQDAFLHMLIEAELLNRFTDLKKKVTKLKQSGVKTEPAFCQAFDLKGNPYELLLQIYNNQISLDQLQLSQDKIN